MNENKTSQSDFFQSAQSLLYNSVRFLRHEVEKADKFRGKAAQSLWLETRELALEAINFVEARLNRDSLLISNAESLESIKDAIYRLHLGFEMYTAQFDRVQWLVIAAEEFRDRLFQRGLIRAISGIVVDGHRASSKEVQALLAREPWSAGSGTGVGSWAGGGLNLPPGMVGQNMAKALAHARVFLCTPCRIPVW